MLHILYTYDGTPMAGCFVNESAFDKFVGKGKQRKVKIVKQSSRQMTQEEVDNLRKELN